MKTIAIRYQSRGGNTAGLARAIATEYGLAAKPISESLETPVDVLFLGGGVYWASPNKELLKFAEALEPEKVKQVVLFQTSAYLPATANKLRKLLENKGIKVYHHSLRLQLFIQGFSPSVNIFGWSIWSNKGGRLTEKQNAKVHDFVHEI
jgi:flavodoxin